MILDNLDYGESIWIQESGIDVEYICVSKDSNSCTIRRKYPKDLDAADD